MTNGIPVNSNPGPYQVSIIIPSYNHARYIGDAIQSVLKQKYRDFEIIVVDDGSTDRTRQVVEQFGDAVRYIWQENRGLSAARNTGIRAARGELIGLLDADDIYLDQYLSTLVPVLQSNPDASAVYCGFQFVDEKKQLLPQVGKRVVPPEQFYSSLIEGNFIIAQCMLVRRSTYEQVGQFDENLRACEDWDMWLRIAREHQVLGVPQVLTWYRLLPGSMSSDPQHMERNRLAVAWSHFGPESGDPALWPALRRRMYSKIYLESVLAYLQRGDSSSARQPFNKALNYDPNLADQMPVFYELGCGNQPKGYRGDLKRLDVDKNSVNLFYLLEATFTGPGVPARLRAKENAAYANAHFALGLLYYGSGKQAESRRQLLTALRYRSGLLFNRQWGSTLLKTLVGDRLIQAVRRWRNPLY